jgi:hypothetical protein
MLSSMISGVYARFLKPRRARRTQRKKQKIDHFVFFVVGTQYFKFNAIIALRKSAGLGHQVRLSQS